MGIFSSRPRPASLQYQYGAHSKRALSASQVCLDANCPSRLVVSHIHGRDGSGNDQVFIPAPNNAARPASHNYRSGAASVASRTNRTASVYGHSAASVHNQGGNASPDLNNLAKMITPEMIQKYGPMIQQYGPQIQKFLSAGGNSGKNGKPVGAFGKLRKIWSMLG